MYCLIGGFKKAKKSGGKDDGASLGPLKGLNSGGPSQNKGLKVNSKLLMIAALKLSKH